MADQPLSDLLHSGHRLFLLEGEVWIELIDAQRIRWVLEQDCLNEKGVACSSTVVIERTQAPIPGWLKAPEQSLSRETMEWIFRFECRSMRSTIQAVLEFYEECISAGGLKRTVPPEIKMPDGMSRPCCGPGFRAESDSYRFNLDAFEHDGIVFWTIQHGAIVPPHPTPPRVPLKLSVVGTTGDQVNLIEENTGEKYSAPVSALRDSRPAPAVPSFGPQKIRWGSLPKWVQFHATEESIGELRGYLETRIEEMWWANREGWFNGDSQEMFVSALQWLDERGFDGSGEQTPPRSYFVSVLQGGASLNLQAQSELGDKAILTVLDTLGHMSINLNYYPANGTPLPPTIRPVVA